MSSSKARKLPLYEGKMIHHYDQRWATYESLTEARDVTLQEKQDPEYLPQPRYWVREQSVRDKLAGKWNHEWFLAWRRIARATDERTLISTRLDASAAGDSIFLLLPENNKCEGHVLQSILASFVFDFVTRQKMGGTNANFFFVEQLPVLSVERLERAVFGDPSLPWGEWLAQRARWLQSAESWQQPNRHVIVAELDAAMFHLYGVERDDVDYIMDTFPIVRRKDEAEFGEYRTKRLILELYDQMSQAKATGQSYSSPFDEVVS